jgi:hypothetical protein
MDKTTNERLINLGSRLQGAYNNAYQEALKRERKALERLTAFEISPNVEPQYIEQAARMHLMRVERETGLVQNIADELSRTADTARSMINGESLNLFEGGYKSQLLNISRQLDNIGIHADFSMINKNAFNAIFNGDMTRLGQLPDYSGAFEQVGVRMIYDRSKGQYFYQRATQRLGYNPDIVRRLQNTLAEALVLGEGIPKIATRIRAITEGSRRQAVTIARTECLRALNQGSYLGAMQAREAYDIPMKKKWVSTHDDKTREQHAEMMGTTAEIDEPFEMPNGDLMYYPLDNGGSAENIINCRCVIVYVVAVSKESQAYRDLVDRVEQKGLTSNDESGIMDSGGDGLNDFKVNTDGLRNEKPLTQHQIDEAINYAVKLDMPREQILYSDALNVSYGSNFDILYLGTDTYPAENVRQGTQYANSRISWRSSIAHEIIGHREAALKKWTQKNQLFEEVQASIRAARFAPDLSSGERITLLRDAVWRLNRDGFTIKEVRDLLNIKER